MFAAMHACFAPLLPKLFLCCVNFWNYLLTTHSTSFIMFSSPLFHPMDNLFIEFVACPSFSQRSHVLLFWVWPGCSLMVFGGICCRAARLLSLYCLITSCKYGLLRSDVPCGLLCSP